MLYVYSLILYLIQPFIWLRLFVKSLKAPAYRRRWGERYGFCRGKVQPNGILIHAVSVGETIAAVPLIKTLQKSYPNLPITVTTMTPTGSDRVVALLGTGVSHVYLPYDLPDAMKRFLTTLRPTLVIVMETELWPNLIRCLYKKAIPLIVANARLSAKSARKYARFSRFSQWLLEQVPLIAAQNHRDGRRFIKLGLPPSHLAVIGSLKFDITLTEINQQQIKNLRQRWQSNRPVILAASTHAGEEEMMLAAFRQLLHQHPTLLLIIVPRHPERFNDVESLVSKHKFHYQLYSQSPIPAEETQIIIADVMGELMLLYGLADIAFVGGSLIPHGGHNPLEPALHALPIVTGPYTFNFDLICHQLRQKNGLFVCTDQIDDLVTTFNQLLTDKQLAQTVGENAALVLSENQGALQRLLQLIKRYLNEKQ